MGLPPILPRSIVESRLASDAVARHQELSVGARRRRLNRRRHSPVIAYREDDAGLSRILDARTPVRRAARRLGALALAMPNVRALQHDSRECVPSLNGGF